MNLPDLDHADPVSVAILAGLRPTPDARFRQGGLYLSPCPCCGAERAHTRSGVDRRGPVHLRAGWTCYGCGATGSRADLLALVRYGVRWGALDREQRASLLDGEAPPARPLPPPPPRLDPETWARLVSLCVSVRAERRDVPPSGRGVYERALDWFARRRLPRAHDLLVIVGGPDPGLRCLWTDPPEGRDPLWLPSLGASLLLPCFDERMEVRGVRLRNVRPDPLVKEQALRGFSAQGLAYIPRGLRMRVSAGEAPGRPVVLAEGKPDQLALADAWRAEAWVVGYYEGSLSGLWTQRIRADLHVHQEDAPDRQGRRKSDTYRARVRELWPDVREIGASRLYGAAGEPWVEGEDVAAMRAAIPRLADL